MEIKNDQNESREDVDAKSPKSKLLPEFIQTSDQELPSEPASSRRFLELFSPGY